MPISPGARLGPYEIVSLLGAGGMGEVYRARDTRLDRTVAIKVVLAPLAGLAEFRERIDREARVVSALEHPHICAIYDIGEHDGAPYLVMQYFEGETLAERLKRGPLPAAQAIAIATQVAGALDAAHRAGVVHRDLKPGNVMLTKGGARLLDFGLAKAGVAAAGAGSVSVMATEQTPMTMQGTILGTWQYMAPEQVEGQEADARTDIFAFGVLLFEMLTGRKAFEGKTQASVFGAILHKDPPDLSSVAVDVPPALARVVRRCLAKDPDQRWQSARDLEWELRSLAEEPAPVPAAPALARTRTRPWLLLRGVLLVAVLAAAAAAGYLLWESITAQGAPVTRLTLPVEPAVSIRNTTATGSIVAISRDGRQVVFTGTVGGGTSQLFVRGLDQETASPLPGTEGALAPAFSPDGRWIAYATAGAVMKVEVAGGAPQAVAKIGGSVRGIAWLDDDWIVYGAQGNGGLMRVRAAGADPEQLIAVDAGAGEVLYGYPSVHPTRPVVFFTLLGSATGTEGDTMAVDIETGAKRTILRTAAAATLTRTGHLLFLRGGNLMAVAMDPVSLDITGVPVTAQANLDAGSTGNWAVAGDGTLVYVRGGSGGGDRRRLAWVDAGRSDAATELERAFDDPRVSPDGRRVAVEITSEGNDIWVLDLARGTSTRLTFDAAEDETPAWSPDGVWVAYASDRPRQPRTVFRKRADGSGGEEKVWTTPEHTHVEGWTPDGRSLLVMRQTSGQNDIWLVPVGGGGEAKPLLQDRFREYAARVSPDGRWLAYTSNESGEDQVYVQPFPELGAKWQISPGGGSQPLWSADGRRLFYRGEGSVMAVDVRADGRALSAGVPRKLLEDTFQRKGDTHSGWDVAPDGRLLLVRAGAETGRPTFVNIALNWLGDVARRAQPER